MKNTFKLGKASKARLKSCNESICKVVEEAISSTPIDFGVSKGATTVDDLKKLFARRKTVINPNNFISEVLKTKTKYKKELYNKVPGLVVKKSDKANAVEVFCASSNIEDIMKVVGHILGTANRVLENETLKLHSRKGGYITFTLSQCQEKV